MEKSNLNNLDNKTLGEIMFLEYQKAQDSAEHHDRMAWFTSSVLVVASIYLFGSLLSIMYEAELFLILFGCGIGFLLIFINMIIFYGAQEIKVKKYRLCKKIEEQFNSILENNGKKYQLENHLMTERFPHYARYLYLIALWTIALGFIIIFVFLISFR